MESNRALAVFDALSQQTRLDAFRLLVTHEPQGLAAGEVARALGVPQNTMSVHLGILSRAGLVSARRSGRSIVYRAEIAAIALLVDFLLTDCCVGRAACAPAAPAENEETAR